MRQEIRFCQSSDGVGLAYATSGDGPPLVKAANYLTHLEHDWQSPVWRHWLRGLSETHRLVRYDTRGSGLSDRDVAAFSIETWIRDLEAVISALGLERFPLLGISQGAAVCVAYAARHPQKVTRLVLYGGYARGRLRRDPGEADRLQAEALIDLIRVGWGRRNPAFRQLFSTLMMPEADEEQMASLNELARISAAPDTASRMERAFYEIDVTELAPKVEAPALVLHARDDGMIPFDEGRRLAALIPEARFVPLESANHILLATEPAWARFLGEVRSFLGARVTEGGEGQAADLFPELTPRERETLELIALGLDNRQIAKRLVVTPKTVRNYASRIYQKLGARSRAHAVVLAREAGLGKNPARGAQDKRQ